ncbi:hypothetical protein NUU61_008830 [Penicillium alfredii]|uniref:Uncharacterized protein n=1 Tax=Penicillium alfredii TaxID=1506179 RepID=A0A9W9EM82_9EURO|nr:uncharacterized protein NUU61_008830 [Penicillium alfredii]KAJ5084251.1 hypothetical protein NUU61_008830 [Penicillium alfredii]
MADGSSSRSLLFVSKSSSSFIEPFLFRKIAWDWKPIPFRRVLLLFRAILQKPERASQIRHLSLVSHEEEEARDDWKPPSCQTDCKKEIASFQDVLHHAQVIVESSGFPDTNTWALALKRGNPYAFVSILLSQLHNLHSLQLDFSFVWQSGFPGLMLRHALLSSSSKSSLSRFNSLTDVDYGANVPCDQQSFGYPEIYQDRGYPQCNPEQFPAWFYLPSLRSLKIWLQTKQGVELPDRTPDLSRLQRLILARTTIQEAQVPKVLSLAPHLETLHLGMAYRWGKETALQDGSFIIQGLESLRESLKNLSFGIEYFPPTMCGNVWLNAEEARLSSPFYGLLKHFHSLHSVEMPANLLAGWATEPSVDLTLGLPATVEQLCLRADYHTIDEEGWHEDCLLDLVTQNAARLRPHMPGLKRLSVRGCPLLFGSPVHNQERDIARAACAREGIEFEVICDDVSNGIWTETRMSSQRQTL